MTRNAYSTCHLNVQRSRVHRRGIDDHCKEPGCFIDPEVA